MVHGRSAVGFLELGSGRTGEAIAMLEQVESFAARSGLQDPLFVPWAPDLVEAYMRAGRRGDAERIATSLDGAPRGRGGPVARACGSLSRPRRRGRLRGRLRGRPRRSQRAAAPFETARSLLAYGSRLHRARRRVDGRARLRAALEIFERLGARPWIGQAEAEFARGRRDPAQPVADPDELSPQEIRVAREVAAGATNREVAARLFLSPKTIDFHLGRVYRKLDIHSRTELATLVARGALVDPPRVE